MTRNSILTCLVLLLLRPCGGLSTRSTTATRRARSRPQRPAFWIQESKRGRLFQIESSREKSVLGGKSDSSEEERSFGGRVNSDKLLGFLVLLTVPLSWGTYVPVVRFLYAIQPPVPGFVFSACYYALAAVTTSSLAAWQHRQKRLEADMDENTTAAVIQKSTSSQVLGGIELGSYLFVANCLQVVALRTVASDRAGFLVQLTTVFVPFVEALFSGKLTTVPTRTWLACIFAFVGLFVMGLDGKIISDPISAFVAALTSFTRGDLLIIGAAILYTLHVVRLGTYARETTPMQLAASKATVETIYSILLVVGLMGLSTVVGEQSGLLGFAASTGKEISTFFSSFRQGLASGSLSKAVLLPALGAVLWTGWVTCAYTIYAQSFGQSRVSPTNANLIYTFQPIFTSLFAWLLLGETMGPSGFVGGAIIALSVYFVASANFGTSTSTDLDEQVIETNMVGDIQLDINGSVAKPDIIDEKASESEKPGPRAGLFEERRQT